MKVRPILSKISPKKSQAMVQPRPEVQTLYLKSPAPEGEEVWDGPTSGVLNALQSWAFVSKEVSMDPNHMTAW